MKQTLRKWTMRLTVTGAFLVALLLGILLNPAILYAHTTEVGNYSIYHSEELDEYFLARLAHGKALLQASELYDSNYKIDICLNDGSHYPTVMRALRGPAFAWGFANKVVLQGTSDAQKNTHELNGYAWNLEQLLAHEMIHCYQYQAYGLWNSNPIASHPNWKWEGYPEYISRQSKDQQDLQSGLQRLQESDVDTWAMTFEDGTIAPKEYYADWLLVKYCMEVKGLSFVELINHNAERSTLEDEMWQWFKKNL